MFDVAEPVLVKFTVAPIHCGALLVNEATVVESITIVIVSTAVQKPLLTEKVIRLLPGVVNTTPVGLSVVEVEGVAPAPKLQS